MGYNYLRFTQNQNGTNKWFQALLSLSTSDKQPQFTNFEQHAQTEGLWNAMARFIAWTTTIGKHSFSRGVHGNSVKTASPIPSIPAIGLEAPIRRIGSGLIRLPPRSLKFLEYGKEGGGGLEHAELENRVQVALTLSNVTSRQIRGGYGQGRGMVGLGSAIFRGGFPVEWVAMSRDDYMHPPP